MVQGSSPLKETASLQREDQPGTEHYPRHAAQPERITQFSLPMDTPGNQRRKPGIGGKCVRLRNLQNAQHGEYVLISAAIRVAQQYHHGIIPVPPNGAGRFPSYAASRKKPAATIHFNAAHKWMRPALVRELRIGQYANFAGGAASAQIFQELLEL
jgi:hypothetical protein